MRRATRTRRTRWRLHSALASTRETSDPHVYHEVAVPRRCGETVAAPSVEQLPQAVTDNAAILSNWRFSLAGQDISDWRQETRADLLRRAHEYTASMGDEPDLPQSEGTRPWL